MAAKIIGLLAQPLLMQNHFLAILLATLFSLGDPNYYFLQQCELSQQGGPSGHVTLFVDIKFKVPSQYCINFLH